uniref:Uncharacterized protein n=1 Tax=Varanus komodoensis TaxID=61221 RepID=A0A8D2IU13_VARKO
MQTSGLKESCSTLSSLHPNTITLLFTSPRLNLVLLQLIDLHLGTEVTGQGVNITEATASPTPTPVARALARSLWQLRVGSLPVRLTGITPEMAGREPFN